MSFSDGKQPGHTGRGEGRLWKARDPTIGFEEDGVFLFVFFCSLYSLGSVMCRTRGGRGGGVPHSLSSSSV